MPQGKSFGVRLDTHGGRFAEGLDYERSVDTVGHWLGVHGEYNIVEQVLGGRAFQLDPNNILVDKVRRILFGKGVSVASIIHVRRALDQAGYPQATIVGVVRIRPAEVPDHGRGASAGGYGRHRQLSARNVDGNVCNRRHHPL